METRVCAIGVGQERIVTDVLRPSIWDFGREINATNVTGLPIDCSTIVNFLPVILFVWEYHRKCVSLHMGIRFVSSGLSVNEFLYKHNHSFRPFQELL